MAIKALNSVAGFSVGEVPSNVIYANGDFLAANLVVTAKSNLNSLSNIYISGGTAGQVISTDGAGNLTFVTISTAGLSNGTSNINVLNSGNINFSSAGTANVVVITNTGMIVDGILSVTGNANVGNLGVTGIYATTVSASGNITGGNLATGGTLSAGGNANVGNLGTTGNIIANNVTVNLELSGNTANFTGNIDVGGILTDNYYYANGAPVDFQQAAGSNTQIQYNNNNDFGASANFTFNDATNLLTVIGNSQFNNANLGNLAIANFINVSSNLNVTDTASVGNLRTDNLLYANGTPWDLQQAAGSNTQVQFNNNNDFGATANFTYDQATNTLGLNGLLSITGNANVSNTINGNVANFSGNITSLNANLGNLATANYVNVSQQINGNVANFSGNLTSLNADLGNLATANYVNVSQQLNGNVGNFSGNITSLNANLGNLAIANYINVANNLSVTGNITGGNIIGTLANGTSNIRILQDANIEFSSSSNANVVTITGTELLSTGNIRSTAGNIVANGNVTANGFLNGANANVTGEAILGSVKTANITAPTGNITISAAGTNENIILNPSGTGNVDVGLHNIVQVGSPINPHDAATKEYVDSLAQGLTIHAPVRVEAPSALNATYTVGGTTQTTTDITGGKTIQFSANHGLSVNDGIVWTNSFNGIVGGEAYWVYSTPALNQITIKDGYFGAEVTTLTNGTGLTQASRANPGVGATLVNAGANAALVIDSISVANGDRVLVYNQANSAHNGVYDVTDKGNVSAAWILTRSSDMDTYIPQSTLGLGYGDYFFVQEGGTGAGESYVLTDPVGEVIIGTDNVLFTQFSSAGAYTAGSGINIVGTIISANVDGVTTDIVSGNIVVKASANLTTPNIGDATFSSLSWNTLSNGNVTANNLSIGNIANVTGNLTVGGNIQANYAISSNANVSGLNLTTNGNVEAGGNVLAGNVNVNAATITNTLTVNNAITGNTANFSGTVTIANLTVNSAITGNTANFSGNVIVPNLTVNLELAGNTANFSGNIDVGGILTDNYYYANGSPVDFQQAAGSNTQIQFNNNNDFGASANLTFNTNTNVLGVTGDANISNAIILGNSTFTWATLTTTSITANQTIASFSVTGVTGVEYFVKGIDSTGSKYSVATVQAVTDGSTADYSTYGTVNIGGSTGTLAVNISGGFVRLQVTPASSNSTVWITQYRLI